MTRVAVIGSTGQLGSDLVAALEASGSYTVIPLSHGDVECTDPASVTEVLRRARPDIVINCAAFVRVDECEERPEEAFRVNTLGALHVARACRDLGAFCVYVSTDYVFDGEKGSPYTEDDVPCPINVYGASKLAGEYLVRQTCPRWLIVRTASLFGKTGARGKDRNFLETIIAKARRKDPISVVNDVRMSPTYARDAARGIEVLLGKNMTGSVHLTNDGSCSWYEFAREILARSGVNGRLEPVSSRQDQTKARRPRDSSLTSSALTAVPEAVLRPWREALGDYLLEKMHA